MYRLIEKLHLERYLNSRLILAIDLVVSGVASLCALVLVRLLLPPLSNISKFALLWIGCAVVYSFITFFLLKTYRSVIRHSTLREIAKFVVAVIGKELLLGLTILLYPPTPLFGMHMLALLLFDLLLTLCGLILIRVAMIIVYDLVKNNLKSRKQHQLVLVYGLSEKSVSLVTRLQSSPHYKVVGFLTFGRRMKNHTIAECPVYYFENEYSIRYLRQRYDIDAVLFPTNEEAQAEQERLIRYCVESNLKILIAPPIDEVIDGKIMRQSIREIKIEDLLGRPEIKISLDEIIANFREKTVMVTGAAGSNGSVIPRFREQIAKGGPVTVTHPDITRFFMTIPEACQLVMEAATISTGNQICVFDMGKSVKIADLAKRMIELAGYEPGEEIKIEYTGLRPGEKLYEEVLSNTENTIPTTHDRIRIAKVREYDYAEACAATEQLEQFARMVNVPDTVCLMKKIVPEFKSKNSEFEQFDKVQPA